MRDRRVARDLYRRRRPRGGGATPTRARWARRRPPRRTSGRRRPRKDKSASPGGDSEDEGDGALRPTAPIATPLADLKTTKKILKVVKKGARDANARRERERDARRSTVVDANGRRPRANARERRGGNGRIVENSGRGATTDETTGERETAAKAKQVRRGVKEVVKALKKETKGVCVIAGDISPIDVITHVPILCEEAGVPYVYVHSKEELGAAGMTKRPTSVMLVMPEGVKGSVKMSSSDKKEFDDMYEKILAKVKSMK